MTDTDAETLALVSLSANGFHRAMLPTRSSRGSHSTNRPGSFFVPTLQNRLRRHARKKKADRRVETSSRKAVSSSDLAALVAVGSRVGVAVPVALYCCGIVVTPDGKHAIHAVRSPCCCELWTWLGTVWNRVYLWHFG